MVYFVQNPVSKLIKIGYSENPLKRIKDLNRVEGVRLDTLLIRTGTIHTEHQFHHMFAKDWMIGEWFYPSCELLECVNEQIKIEKLNTHAMQCGY